MKNIVAEYIKENGISTCELARRAKMKQVTVWRIANGRIKRMSPDSASSLSIVIGVPEVVLLYPDKFHKAI